MAPARRVAGPLLAGLAFLAAPAPASGQDGTFIVCPKQVELSGSFPDAASPQKPRPDGEYWSGRGQARFLSAATSAPALVCSYGAGGEPVIRMSIYPPKDHRCVVGTGRHADRFECTPGKAQGPVLQQRPEPRLKQR